MTIYTVDWPSFLKKKEVIYHYNFYFIHEFIARGGKHWRFIKFASSRLIQFRKGRQRGKQRRAVERRRVLEDKRREGEYSAPINGSKARNSKDAGSI